ncbi:hypothetical protein LINGRAHAP2_LOCUS5066 [Linum grandiflorum]
MWFYDLPQMLIGFKSIISPII